MALSSSDREYFAARLEASAARIVPEAELVRRMEREASELLEAWRQNRDYGPVPPGGQPDRKFHDAFRQLGETLALAQEKLTVLTELQVREDAWA